MIPLTWIVFLVGCLIPRPGVFLHMLVVSSCSKRHLIFDTLNVAPRFTRMDWPSWRHEWRGEVPEPIRVDFLVCQTRSKKHRNLGRLKPPKRTAGTPKKRVVCKGFPYFFLMSFPAIGIFRFHIGPSCWSPNSRNSCLRFLSQCATTHATKVTHLSKNSKDQCLGLTPQENSGMSRL